MFSRTLPFAAAVASLFAMASAAHAAKSYDVAAGGFTLTSDGKYHTILTTPASVTGTWHVTGTVNVALAYGNFDLACFAGGPNGWQNRVDLFLNQTQPFNNAESLVVDGLVTVTTPQPVGFMCAVFVSPGSFGTPQFANAHLTAVPVASATFATQTAPRD